MDGFFVMVGVGMGVSLIISLVTILKKHQKEKQLLDMDIELARHYLHNKHIVQADPNQAPPMSTKNAAYSAAADPTSQAPSRILQKHRKTR